MLSGEGMQRRKTGEKQQQVLSKNTLHVQHTFFVHFFAVALHDYNVKRPETSQLHVLWRKCCMCSRSLFFIAAHFHLAWWPLAFLILSPPLHKIFMLFFEQKNVSFGFSSLALNPCRPFSRENLSQFNTLDNTDTETIFAFRFRLYQGHLYEEK